MKIPGWKSFEYVEVRRVVEKRDGCVLRTKHVGFAHRDRERRKDEVYSAISTKLLVDGNGEALEVIELELI